MRSTTSPRAAAVALVTTFTVVASAPGAAAATFSNTTSITVNDAPSGSVNGTASPYPSTISVTGLTGTITDVNVTVSGVTHGFPPDLAIAVVGPNGDALLLVSGVGLTENNDISNLNWTFDDAAAARLPNDANPVSGSFKPSAYANHVNVVFPAPGPASYAHPGPEGGPSNNATLASVFNGDNPNGDWKLFVIDIEPGDGGSINAGWSLDITTNGTGGGGGGGVSDTVPPATSLTKQPPKETFKTKAKFKFTADEPATFECSLDGGKFKSCASPFTKKKLAPGKHKFKVRAIDLAGNKDGSPAKWTWTVKEKD
jgi:subtilisin-like proprotein convertase family protein